MLIAGFGLTGAAMRRRRCIFIADAFYEWRRDASVKGKGKPQSQPFLIRRADGAPMAFAGLWETWTGPNGEEVDGACVLTTPANQLISAIHDRMPVILEPEDFDRWLDADSVSAEEALALCAAVGEDVLEYWLIATDVNKVANDDVSIQTAVGQVVRGGEAAPRRPAARQGDLFG